MDYLISGKKFSFSYKELEKEYHNYLEMNNEDFFSNLPRLLHFVSFVSYIKEISSEILLCDDGLLHELIHLLEGVETVDTKNEIREKFKILMRL